MGNIKHGGNIYDTAREWNVSPYDILDFSANINPLGTPPGLTRYIEDNWQAILHYPDPGYRRLYEALADYLNVDERYIILGNGAIDIIYDYMRVMKPKRVLIPSPTFSEYKRAAVVAGAQADIWPLAEGFTMDVDALCTVLSQGGHDMVILCNPNNPTGGLLNRSELIAILDCTKRYDINVLLDETFIEFTEDYSHTSMADVFQYYSNLCIVRAFTKFFAMPGLRLGYCIADARIKEMISDIQPPWRINAMAALAGVYVLNDKEFMVRTRRLVKEQRDLLQYKISATGKMHVYPSQADFMLIKSLNQHVTADVVQRHLQEYRILVRNASNFDGLNEYYIRVAVRDADSNRCLIKALEDFA
ncbi:MAG: threonine-phosphate decarboxylase [Clostridiales bacterium]|jgi:threonine-phosphate decarboxylase|nr:threonine-phosphate decarboxylase [Clostridiales bacterium]MDK2991353.1 threonine-phosphate decarboxylase [Clostridiales bacterium]